LAESYTYDLADKMLTAGAKSYTYDAAGRTVGINAPGGPTTLSYDYKSRVTAISGPGINETHTYNGLDTRVGTVQGGVPRTFVRDGSYVTDPVLRDGQATYTPGVSERRGGVSTWSHSGLKNADAQTTSVGAIAATRVLRRLRGGTLRHRNLEGPLRLRRRLWLPRGFQWPQAPRPPLL